VFPFNYVLMSSLISDRFNSRLDSSRLWVFMASGTRGLTFVCTESSSPSSKTAVAGKHSRRRRTFKSPVSDAIQVSCLCRIYRKLVIFSA
jgi:hypothetical protein